MVKNFVSYSVVRDSFPLAHFSFSALALTPKPNLGGPAVVYVLFSRVPIVRACVTRSDCIGLTQQY